MRRPVPFGKYLLLDRIAVGGMAEVFAAKAFGVEGFERTIAIKRILPNMVEDDEFIAMFIDEARIAALLTHANIAQIYELGRHDETYYIAMEYVSGRDARLVIDRFRKKGQLVPFPMAAYILAKMAEGLDYAHAKRDQNGQPLGIIHRDISPQNVLVSYDGDVKLIDFGIAKAAGRSQKTQAGILKGKFAYMSPEQVRGIPIDYRSDLYSAGVMLYEMITGTRLFTGESDFSTLEKVRAGTVRAPSEINADIPPQLEQVVLKALAKDRDERYQSGAELHDDLMRFLFSGKEIYSAKNLASYMKEAFADDYKKEQERIRRWQETTADDVDDAEFGQPQQKKKVRIGGESTSSAQKGKAEPRSSIRKGSGGRGEPDEDDAPIDDMATQVRNLDDMATQVRAVDEPTDGATAIIRRPEQPEASESQPPPKKEKTALLDEREILANSKPPARKRRSRARLPAVAVGVSAICLALGVANLQINKGQHGLLIVIKGPRNAQAFVDGNSQALGHGQFLFRGTPEDHALKVTADGFTPFEAKFSIASSSNPLEVTLTKAEAAPPPPPQPTVKVEPPDAGTVTSAEVDAGMPGASAAGQEPPKNEKDREQQLKEALHHLSGPDAGTVAQQNPGNVREQGSAKDPAHPEGQQNHVVENGAPNEGVKQAPPPPPPPEKVSLAIATTTPPSAMVMIRVDGKGTGGPKKTPVTVPDLKAGQVVAMQFVASGYEPLSQQYTMNGHGDSVSVAMVKVAAPPPPPADAKAMLKVMCVPKAKIVVDDKVVGHTSPPGMTEIEVTAGKHHVCCESETGTRSTLKELVFAAGGEQVYKARVQ